MKDKSEKNGNLHEHQPSLGKVQHSPTPKPRQDLNLCHETLDVFDPLLTTARIGVTTRQTSRTSSASTVSTTPPQPQSQNSTSLVNSDGIPSTSSHSIVHEDDNSEKHSNEMPSATTPELYVVDMDSDTTSPYGASSTHPEHNNTNRMSQRPNVPTRR